MEILFVSKPVAPPWNDSSKNLVRDLATGMTRHRAVVLTTRDAAERLTLGAAAIDPIYPARAGAFAPSLGQNARVLRRLLTGPRGDLWHFFFAPNPRSSRLGSLASRLRRVPTVHTVCSAPRPELDPRAVLFADRTVVLSRHTEARLRDAGVPAEHLCRIPPAVAALAVPDEPRRREVRRAFGLPGDRPLVLYPGDLEFGTGAQLSLDAFADVHASRGAFLAIASRIKTPAARRVLDSLRAEVDRRGLGASVAFLGETPRILELLGAADVVALPADTLYAKMDLPLVLLEAMALGRPVIVAEGTPAAELAEGGAAIAVAPEREALAAALASLLDDGAARARLGAEAQAAVRTRHTPAAMAAAYEDLYDDLAAARA